jgi:predicted MFS family arabinose efflux permease
MTTKTRAASLWFAGTFILFAARGILMATWSNQGPAVKSHLALDVASMGLYQMVISLASFAGVLVAGRLLHKLGSRYVSLVTYLLMAVSLVGLGWAVSSHSVLLAVVFTSLIGAPFGIADYGNNFEAGEIDRNSSRNKVPMLHFGYSAAVLVGGLLSSLFISLDINVAENFTVVAIIVAIAAIVASMMIPKNSGKQNHDDDDSANKVTVLDVLRERRFIKITAIAFAFVVSEASGMLWIPITLTGDGMNGTEAALAFTVFAFTITVMRLIGGRIADKLGRQNAVRYLSLIATAGIVIFMATPIFHMPFVGIAIWGIGNSFGISMTVAAMSDTPVGAHAKQTLLWTVVYLANITVGPVLGFISTFAGNYASFVFPIATLLMAFAFSANVKPKVDA